STRGWHALKTVDAVEEIEKISIPMDKRAIHNIKGEITYQPYGIHGEAIYSVSRGDLNRKIVDLAEKAGAQFAFNRKIEDVLLQDATIFLKNLTSQEKVQINLDLIYGTDCAFLNIRQRMQN